MSALTTHTAGNKLEMTCSRTFPSQPHKWTSTSEISHSHPTPSHLASHLQDLPHLSHLRAGYRNTTLVWFRTVLGLLCRMNCCVLGPSGHQIGPRRTWWGGHRQSTERAVAVSSLCMSQAVPLGLVGGRDVPHSFKLIDWGIACLLSAGSHLLCLLWAPWFGFSSIWWIYLSSAAEAMANLASFHASEGWIRKERNKVAQTKIYLAFFKFTSETLFFWCKHYS